jgi:hypothetical protein
MDYINFTTPDQNSFQKNIDFWKIYSYYPDMISRNKIFGAMPSVLVAVSLLVSAVPQASVICACRAAEQPPADTQGAGCGGMCSMEMVRVEVEHPDGCTCADCRHVEITNSDVQLYLPGSANFDYHENVLPAALSRSARDDQHTRTAHEGRFTAENRFTQQTVDQLSTTIIIC